MGKQTRGLPEQLGSKHPPDVTLNSNLDPYPDPNPAPPSVPLPL